MNKTIPKKERKFKRVCLGCNQLLPKVELLKFAVKINSASATGCALEIDHNQRIPSRSLYVYPSPECFQKVLNKRKAVFKKLKVNPHYFTLLKKQIEPLFIKMQCPCDNGGI